MDFVWYWIALAIDPHLSGSTQDCCWGAGNEGFFSSFVVVGHCDCPTRDSFLVRRGDGKGQPTIKRLRLLLPLLA